MRRHRLYVFILLLIYGKCQNLSSDLEVFLLSDRKETSQEQYGSSLARLTRPSIKMTNISITNDDGNDDLIMESDDDRGGGEPGHHSLCRPAPGVPGVWQASGHRYEVTHKLIEGVLPPA